jgi:hypothetical protein
LEARSKAAKGQRAEIRLKKRSPEASSEAAGRDGRRSPTQSERFGSGGEETSLGNVSRGEPLCTFVNEIIGLPLALTVFPQVYDFPGDEVLQLVEQGLYKKGWHTNHSTT